MKFKKDVVLDIVCYRRHGHNEADEPSITQPIMYQAIKKQKTVTQTYIDKLVSEATISAEQATAKIEEYRKNLDERRSVRDTIPGAGRELSAFDWAPYLGHDLNTTIQTAVNKKQLQALHQQLMKLPEGFVLQPQVAREMQTREEMLAGKIPLNWGCAETLAYASLLAENYNVRLSGQDCGRGTFSHRHAMLHNQARRGAYIPLQNLAQGKGRFTVIDSVLSEAAVLGFEYGYATADPTALVIWEAQFGDFANGAQVVVDQFLSSGEQKWGRLCGLVMLLPHGYEGQGPEHSSARLERYLQLCAQHNMQVCVPSTPAQIFHLLRRQLLRPVRKPLIVMTPKSLLRHKLATSPLADLASGEFQLLIPEIDKLDKKQVTRVVVCSGKVYYELLEARRSEERNDVAIIRIEQLYPFPDKELKQKLAFYTQAEHVIWCQEEPMNQGAWYSTQHHLHSCLAKWQSLTYAGREHFASPAGGIVQVHKEQQLRLVKSALG
jgi:2-oxoglutarate dehydrogenase E1 component